MIKSPNISRVQYKGFMRSYLPLLLWLLYAHKSSHVNRYKNLMLKKLCA